MKEIILTGDRTSGKLHLGHFVGSLANRVQLQETCKQFIIMADTQALTSHFHEPHILKKSIYEIAIDYLSVGIDPKKSTIFIQSLIPELFELTSYFLNLVTWNRLKHNPTIKAEIVQKGFNENIPAGFMIYPISQAADITAFNATLVPVGEDQAPMMEQTIEIVRKFNQMYNKEILVEPKILVSKFGRLPGTDGHAKMSKSLNNAIYLSDGEDDVVKKVKGMYTDPTHLKVEDPGKVEGNPVFIYLDAFDNDKIKLEEMKVHYRRGGLGDSIVKKRLVEVLQEFLTPIRNKRKELEKDPQHIWKMLFDGSEMARSVASETLKKVKQAMQIYYS